MTASRRSGLAPLLAYWLGLSILWGALTTVVVPAFVAQRVPQDVKSSAVALVAALQAVVAIAVQPVAGALSDRLLTRWGRRRPWIAVGVLLQLVALASLLVAPGYWSLLLIMAGVELASNAAQGPYQGLLPDLVPPGRRDTASGLMGAAQLGGQIVGAAAAGLALALGEVDLAIAFAAASVGIGAMATVLGVREPAGRPAWPADGTAPERIGLSAAIGRIWSRDLLAHHEYLWLLASRLAILMAAGTLQPFILFYLQDALRLGNAAGPLVAPIAGTVALAAAAAAIPGASLATRFGRVRVVSASALAGAVGAACFAIAPNYLALFPVAIPFGVALGAFLAADWALLADIVPAAEAGRYLGLSNTATAGSALLAVALAGPLADLVNGVSFGLGYRAIFLLAAMEFAVGSWAISHVPEPSHLVAPDSSAMA